MVRAIKNMLARVRNGQAFRLRAERARLVPLALSSKPGCLVARHRLQALTHAQLRAEVGR